MDGLVNFSEFTEFPLKCFKVYGLVPYDNGTSGLRKEKLLKIYRYFVFTNLSMCVLMYAVYVKQNAKNLTLITENVPLPGYGILAMAKSILILAKKQEFKDLVETLNELFPKNEKEQKTFNTRSYFKSYKLMERVVAFIVSSSAASFAIVPVVNFILTGTWIDKLPFDNCYPFNQYDVKYYNFVFVWTCFNIMNTIMSLLGPDLILYAFITLISMNFDILCIRLRKLKVNSVPDNAEKLIELVKLHKTLIRLSENLEKIYSPSIFTNFFGASVLICLAGYQVTVGTDFDILVKFIIHLAASMVQILMVCYYGSKLTGASLNVSDAIYDCGWNHKWSQEESRKLKMTLMMVDQRSQKPTFISAYKFTVVSLSAFTTVSIQE